MGLKVLFVSVEVSPFAKVGGLADVAGSLPKALKSLGHDVRTIMPAYPLNAQAKLDSKPVLNDFKVSINDWWHKRAQLTETLCEGVPVYMLSTDEWFSDVEKSDQIYGQGIDAYLFFSRGVLAACKQLNWIPDVIHCNDWHTGLIPALMREGSDSTWESVATLFTIHNLAYQGEFGPDILDKLGLSRELFNMHQLETYGFVNFLKSGCAYADHVNTVSPTYAQEVQTAEYGCRLEGLMAHLSQIGQLSGILNGIDEEEWNPATDLKIAANYSADHPERKAVCREALFRELKLQPIPGVPIAGMVSRLSEQKGMDRIVRMAPQFPEWGLQLIVQGLGDPWLADRFTELEKAFPKHIRFAQKFDVQLAQHIYSGSDLFLMPSAFEPCGLGQMIAMRYGTVPVVRKTGGLADTVFDGENGFVFDEASDDALALALKRSIAAFSNPLSWQQLVQHVMRLDHSWDKSATTYGHLYRQMVDARSQAIRLASSA